MPIRVKLTAWYFAVLAVTFVLFGAVAFFAMQKSIESTVDESLRDRAEGIRELMERVLPKDPERLADVLREHAELQEEGDLSQVADPDGHWIYRSRLMRRYDVPTKEAAGPVTYNLQIQKLPLRILATQARLSGGSYYIQVAAPMDDFQDALNHFKWVLLLISPLLLLLASAGGYWMSRRALTPVDAITQAAQTITSRNLSSRLAVPQSRDELQRLSETLNGMLERLEAAFKRITQFTADASHELRTPVALMRTTAELSLRRPRQETEYREALTQILRELETTSTLIEKLMLLARADSGVEALQFAHTDLADNFREACRQGRTLAQAKELSFQEQIIEGPIIVDGDAYALQRLFLILLDNAVKYTPGGGQVKASLSDTNGFAVAEIRDTGIGIGEADLPHIFERFYRADKARSREMGGVGLGLSIGRWIAEAHGGTMEVESTVGQGSVFRLRLPILRS
ncbi:MAG: HAMP domain-containing protein [Acidobacteriia bacterium]|nr:HAMP domain-containing protein [Terriglobia bacterium]